VEPTPQCTPHRIILVGASRLHQSMIEGGGNRPPSIDLQQAGRANRAWIDITPRHPLRWFAVPLALPPASGLRVCKPRAGRAVHQLGAALTVKFGCQFLDARNRPHRLFKIYRRDDFALATREGSIEAPAESEPIGGAMEVSTICTIA